LDIERLANVWKLLNSSVTNKQITSAEAKLIERTTALRAELQRLEQDKTRLTTALQAKSQRILIELVEGGNDKERVKKALIELPNIFEASRGMIEFPTGRFIDLLAEISDLFPLNPNFDEVFEFALEIAQARESKATAGRMLLKRGLQKLEHNQPYEAIRFLGRAQQALALRECREDLVTAFAACAQAYEQAGLLWAARASMLFATKQALNEFHDEGVFTRQAQGCLLRLSWLELQLGRVPSALSWIETTALLHPTIALDDDEKATFKDQWIHLDFTTGVLLLRTELFDLKRLTRLAPALEQLNPHFSWIALMYVLGHEARLRKEHIVPVADGPEDVLELFVRASQRVETGDLPEAPTFLDGQKIEMKSSVLGCEIVVELPNQNRSMFLAEGMLAALEAFLATSLHGTIVPYAAHLRIKLVSSDFLKQPLEWISDRNHSLIEVMHSSGEIENHAKLHNLIAQLVLAITSQIAVFDDSSRFEDLIEDEQALARALSLTHVAACVGNILGPSPKLRLSDWEISDGETFPLLRNEPWNSGQKQARPNSDKPTSDSAPDEDLPLTFETEKLKHRDFTVLSVINIPLWDKAKWSGVVFGWGDEAIPPILGLIFTDKHAGEQIFTAWRHDIGSIDKAGRLRVTVLKGIDRNHPSHYRVVIGTNIDGLKRKPGAHYVMTSKSCTMTPSTTTNLDAFLENLRRTDAFFLAPGFVDPGTNVPSFERGLTVFCKQLNVRNAWEVGPHDVDASGIFEDDDILIPAGISNPPVLERINQIKNRKRDSLHPSPIPRPAKVGRNELCPCGSGKKFKRCHGG